VADNPRIEELRRRVQKDPGSIAFAQLAEEYRRAGEYEEAVRVSRAGLERHPSYLSARVTLGRTLIELERYPEAQTELDFVLRSAPENLAAIRGLAEIHQRRGDLNAALRQYQTALGIAKHDPELEESVYDLARQLGESAPPTPIVPPSIPVDIAIEMIAAPPELETFSPVPEPKPVPATPALSSGLEEAADEFTKALQALDALSLDLPAPSLDAPAVERTEDHVEPVKPADPVEFVEPAALGEPVEAVLSGDDAVADELESWLDSIVLDRNERALASQGVQGDHEEHHFPDLPDLPVNSTS
jgi:tetratricopeptide (TPR) repeat protein